MFQTKPLSIFKRGALPRSKGINTQVGMKKFATRVSDLFGKGIGTHLSSKLFSIGFGYRTLTQEVLNHFIFGLILISSTITFLRKEPDPKDQATGTYVVEKIQFRK